MSAMLTSELAGMAKYRAGRAPLRDADGHPKGRTIAEDDDDDADDESDDDDDETEDDESDDDADTDADAGKDQGSKKGKGRSGDADDDADAEETVPAFKYERLQRRIKAADRRSSELLAENERLKSEGIKDEDLRKEIDESRASMKSTTDENLKLKQQVAFLSAEVKGTDGKLVEWESPAAAMKLVDFSDVIDPETGQADPRAMRAAVRRAIKEYPFLVKKTKASATADADDDGDDYAGESTATRTPKVNGRRKGARQTDRAGIEKQIPAVGRFG